MASLNYFLKTISDYVITVTSASILNLDVVTDMVNELDKIKNPVYVEPLNSGHDCDYVSGSFTITNRPAAKLLIENLSLMPVYVNDDMAFGTAFKKLQVSIVNIKIIIYSMLQLENICNFELKKLLTSDLNLGAQITEMIF